MQDELGGRLAPTFLNATVYASLIIPRFHACLRHTSSQVQSVHDDQGYQKTRAHKEGHPERRVPTGCIVGRCPGIGCEPKY